MKTDNSLLLGTGGDNSVTGVGYFFEGAITSGYPSDATENAAQATIVSATTPSSPRLASSLAGLFKFDHVTSTCTDTPNV